jgi:hypothetical protein
LEGLLLNSLPGIWLRVGALLLLLLLGWSIALIDNHAPGLNRRWAKPSKQQKEQPSAHKSPFGQI